LQSPSEDSQENAGRTRVQKEGAELPAMNQGQQHCMAMGLQVKQ